jgi:flagellar protein FlgJ
MDRKEFILSAYAAARKAREGNAPINPIAAAAQAALESNYGASGLARDANNLFGIKKGGNWTGPVLSLPTHEVDPALGDVTVTAEFRKYGDWSECFRDYGAIIGRLSFYADAVAAKDDPAGFIRGLAARDGEPGWATDPNYVTKVTALIDQWRGVMEASVPAPAPSAAGAAAAVPAAAAPGGTGERYVVAVLALNLRATPAADGEIVTQLPGGQVVTKLGEEPGGEWWHVAADLALARATGFVRRQFLVPA